MLTKKIEGTIRSGANEDKNIYLQKIGNSEVVHYDQNLSTCMDWDTSESDVIPNLVEN